MSTNTVWNRSQQPLENRNEEELLVFGYSCKIFRDDEKATYIDEGKHLIPWMGDESLMIDRYDARGYLHDLAPYEAKAHYDDDDNKLLEEEKMFDEERYLALRSKQSEEELYHEEELKRLRAAVATDGAYHEIGFSYDTTENQIDDQKDNQNLKETEPTEEPYVPPTGLEVPQGMHVPSNMKIHAIIEKTANFISQQGGQMEIIIKMKQGDNPQFAFMNFDNPLHPYYRFLIQELKSGRYKVLPDKKVKEVEDEQHDGHYLHPSLMAKKQEDVPKFTVPSINFRRTGDDSYSLLVKNLKPRIAENQNSPVPETSETESPVRKSHKYFSSDSSEEEDDDGEPYVDPPPPDVQPIIDKMAEYVAKNGEDFEIIVKSKNDKRFDFLNEGHQYYSYYVSRRNIATQKRWPNAVLPPPPPPPMLQRPLSSFNSLEKNAPMVKVEPPKLVTLSVSDSAEYIITKPIPTLESQSPSNIYGYEPDSIDITLSPRIEPKEILRAKHKMKGPISFSLKAKESDVQGEYDSESTPGGSPSIREQDNELIQLKRLSQLDKIRKLSPEELEARLAEEKLKDKIMAAAREKLAQQKREKQLQLERKQKAAVFLKMLQIKKMNEAKDKAASSSAVNEIPKAEKNGNESPHSNDDISPDRKELITSFPPSPISSFPVEGEWSGSDASDHEGENKSKENLTQDLSSKKEEMKTEDKVSLKKSHKSHKSSKSKKRKRSRSRSRSRSRNMKSPRNKSPSRKEKRLPSAYALDKKSRSRSRSPKRYSLHSRGRSPLHWSRYRS